MRGLILIISMIISTLSAENECTKKIKMEKLMKKVEAEQEMLLQNLEVNSPNIINR